VLIGAIKLTEVGSFYDLKSAIFCCVLRWCREADPNVSCVGDVRRRRRWWWWLWWLWCRSWNMVVY